MIPGRPRATRRAIASPRFMGVSGIGSTDPATVAGLAVGPAVGKRVHFGISWAASGGRTLDAVTFGGAPCSRQTRANSASVSSNFEWWSIETALGVGDLGLDWSGSILGGLVGVFWAPRTGSITTASGTTFSEGSSGTTLSSTVDTFDGGYLLAGGRWGTNPRSAAWAGATEVFDIGNAETFAWLPLTSAQTGRAITITLDGAADLRRMAVLAVR